ncbi:MAG: nitronate monooxygenase [bacterium]|jgi:enoyl-[acyl-carrier protein] reductase II
MATGLLDGISKAGREFLGVRYPFLCGAMTWISDPRLVAAVSNAGGFASLAGGNMPTKLLERQVEETRELTDKPFAVNLITIAPVYMEHLETVCRLKVPFIVFAGSFPKKAEVQKAKACGARVLCFASTRSMADRMLEYGADGLILEGMEAGGHVGRVTLTILLQQVLFEVSEVPVFVAGGIATGRMCAHLFLMGAYGVQFGTLFAVSKESCAHPRFKQAFIRARARDAVSTPAFDSRLSVVPVRALRNSSTDDFSQLQLDLMEKLDAGEITSEQSQLRVEEFWAGRLRDAVVDGDVSRGSMMAGQSVGLVNREASVKHIIDKLASDTEAELRRIRTQLGE